MDDSCTLLSPKAHSVREWWNFTETKVSILRESGACGCRHSHAESPLVSQICITPTHIARMLKGVKGLEGLKAITGPNGFPPSSSPKV